jgi:hypothetical protein
LPEWARFVAHGSSSSAPGSHVAIRALVRELKLPLVRVLRGGFGMALRTGSRVDIHPNADAVWQRAARVVEPLADAHRRGGGSWDTATAACSSPSRTRSPPWCSSIRCSSASRRDG